MLIRAENYALKMRLDQEKSKKGDQKVTKKEPKLIVEMLKFDQEKKEDQEVKVQEQPFILKEVKILSKNSPLMTCPGFLGGFGETVAP